MALRVATLLAKLAPVILILLAAAIWIADVENGGPYVLRNLLPLLVLMLLAFITVRRGDGTWSGGGMRMPLGTLGFAIPALGLSLYLHYAYSVNLGGMFSDAQYPGRVFRYLPAYTLIAGAIGFAIGWIVGRNV